ncbi:hypothetical protein GCM10017783_04810 [Deinococcus piscis]|uniref:DinB-like domain-containing protein n=1 Tax=Deinococcus piscis TaxID=394230 RepID=A0ABQ3JYS5_9DEIO|nr:DinB family protein [Deinococcus piscis]GHF95936.1 hypothetical protein GCM10017783_04810 [Deinococcus piscis]
MTLSHPNPFAAPLRDLLRETFEGTGGQGSMYIDGRGRGSLLETLSGLSALQASERTGNAPSIAAHVGHTRYYLRALRTYLAGDDFIADWPGSWQPSEVDEPGWAELQGELASEYHALLTQLEQIIDWNEDLSTDALATLAHSAYHLGAVRLLARHFVSSDS